jgi:serine/threonine protein kinase
MADRQFEKTEYLSVNDSGTGTASHAAIPPAKTEVDPFIGKQCGNCSILERINEGGTAYIYLAHNLRFDLKRVVKILKPSLVEEQDFFLRFKQEAQLVARFDHPNILRVFDTGEENGYFYIEMEFVEGQTLREYAIRNPRINERELLSIAVQIVGALDYAHNIAITGPNGESIKGILHRDIKPENIMITPAKQVKLMDFGAARPLNISSHTIQGMIVGTFHYMSPEQISGSPLDPRSDFFSLGIVLYELATGKQPFSSDSLTELIKAIRNSSYTRARKIRPSISPLTEELIDRLLARDPDHRPSSAKEIIESLNHCINSYLSFGTFRKISVPFSLKRYFSTIALVLSVAALGLSSVAFLRTISVSKTTPKFSEAAFFPFLEKGKAAERRERWDEAIAAYKLVPPLERGGLANEYLEAQIRMAAIMILAQADYGKARKILEDLKGRYSDPAIDAYLGRVYYEMGLYTEAQERLETALKATVGSVIPQTPAFKRDILYVSAATLDKRFQTESHNDALLIEAIKAWNYFIEFSGCAPRSGDEECAYANKRSAELSKLAKGN